MNGAKLLLEIWSNDAKNNLVLKAIEISYNEDRFTNRLTRNYLVYGQKLITKI